jgi:hypothetical protein
MNKNIIKQLDKEIFIFIGLSVVNIIFAAIALAMGISFIVNNLFHIIETGNYISLSLGYIIAGVGLACIGFWWILPSVSVMDFNTEIQFEFSKKKGKITDEKITSLIVNMISYYRENNRNIKRMIFISRIGGIFFIINGLVSTTDFIIKLNSSSIQISDNLVQIGAIILIFSWGILSLFIPRFISKFANFWEYRIKKSQEAEELIRKTLESQ